MLALVFHLIAVAVPPSHFNIIAFCPQCVCWFLSALSINLLDLIMDVL